MTTGETSGGPRRYCSELYCTELYCTVLYCTILYCTQVLENSAQEAVLKVLPLTNKPVRNIRLGCEVAGAVDRAGARADQLFRGQVTSLKLPYSKKRTTAVVSVSHLGDNSTVINA